MATSLNHSFLVGIAHRQGSAAGVAAAELVLHANQRLGSSVLVHPDLRAAETGAGPFLAWANRNRADPTLAPLVELLLRTTSGPWLTELETQDVGAISPAVGALSGWLQESIRVLLGNTGSSLTALVSPAPAGGADVSEYTAREGVLRMGNWRTPNEVDTAVVEACPNRSTAEVLADAAAQVGEHFVVLDTATRSARAWVLDCSAADLHRALLGLQTYARELARRMPDGTRPSREHAADIYHHETGIPMSREAGAVGRQPSRRRQRTFNTGTHGVQFFDMHAKPGTLTRVHVWVGIDDDDAEAPPIIFVGHCGEHLR